MFYDRTMGIHSIFYLSLYLSTLTPTHIHTHACTNAHAHMHAHTQRYTLIRKEGKRGFTSTVNFPGYSERRPRQESRVCTVLSAFYGMVSTFFPEVSILDFTLIQSLSQLTLHYSSKLAKSNKSARLYVIKI